MRRTRSAGLVGLLGAGTAALLGGCLETAAIEAEEELAEANPQLFELDPFHRIVTALSTYESGSPRTFAGQCPKGMKALGAGWDEFSPRGDLHDFSSAQLLPDGSAFAASALQHPALEGYPWKFELYATCIESARVPGHEVIFRDSGPLDVAPVKSVEVTCPSGKKVVGAGWSFELAGLPADNLGHAREFTPTAGGAGWRVEAALGALPGQSWNLRLGVACAAISTVIAETVVHGEGDGQTGCPAGLKAAASGWRGVTANGARHGVVSFRQVPLADGRGWRSSVSPTGRREDITTYLQTVCLR